MTSQLGSPLPPGDEHAVSVCIPTWDETLRWAKRDPDLLLQLQTGYPRFFVPRLVQKLEDLLLSWLASESGGGRLVASRSLCLLFPAEYLATACQTYLESCEHDTVNTFRVEFSGAVYTLTGGLSPQTPCNHDDLYMVVYPQQLRAEGKAFWQHTGFGISSRCGSFWLQTATFLTGASKIPGINIFIPNLPRKAARNASQTIRRRIGILMQAEVQDFPMDAIVLYPTGMSAISHTASALRVFCRDTPSVCRVAVFGFLYVDTFKVLSKVFGFDCKLYGHALSSDLNTLEEDLRQGLRIDALYTEFPGNPLLRSIDRERLHELADKYGFLLIVDDTVATSVNVHLIKSCDVVCTSLTKMFSGACNVMGGSVVLNPDSKHYESIKRILNEQFIDTYHLLDVIVMEENSRGFEARVVTANRNAEALVEILRRHPIVVTVYYPKGSPTQDIYEQYKRPKMGYGYLLSIKFVTPAAAIAFYDALEFAKGPSLGTNFTLCCAYTLFAHFNELDWAANFGVTEHLIRISVGVEEQSVLEQAIRNALSAAEKTSQSTLIQDGRTSSHQ